MGGRHQLHDVGRPDACYAGIALVDVAQGFRGVAPVTGLASAPMADTYTVAQLEEAIAWFQQGDRVSCPFEQVWSKTLAQEIVKELRRPS